MDTASIIERLEGAQEGSVDLDAEIAWHCGGYREQLGDAKFETWVAVCRCTNEFKYSRSIDSALSLVPEDESSNFEVSLEQSKRQKRTYWDATIGHMHFDAWAGRAPTPAIALCIAALRARVHKREG